MSEHSASGNEWWWQVVRISVEHHETRVEALTAEATAIANERPVWNRVGRLPVSHEALFGSDGDMQIDDRAAAAAMNGALRPLVDGIHKERHFLPSKARQHQSAPQRQKRS